MNVFLGMTERMSSDLWRVCKWNQNLIFQNLQKVKKAILNVCIHVFVISRDDDFGPLFFFLTWKLG